MKPQKILKNDFVPNTVANLNKIFEHPIIYSAHIELSVYYLFSALDDGNVVVDLRLLSLSDALGDPDDVTYLLLLQFEVGVKYTKVELLQERKYIQLHLSKPQGGS